MQTFTKEGKTHALLSELTPWKDNPRSVEPEDLERLKVQIKKLGLYKPLIVNEEGVIVGGNMRWLALRELGETEAYVSIVKAVTDAEKLEFALSDNDSVGVWDKKELVPLLVNAQTNIDLTQFKVSLQLGRAALDLLPIKVQEDDFNPDAVKDSFVNLGEVWQLDSHRVMCGDSTKTEDVARLMQGETADLVFTDPPYGVSYGDKNLFLNTISRGNHIQNNFENDTLPLEEMHKLWLEAFKQIHSTLKKGGIYYVCAPPGGELLLLLLKSLQEAGLPSKHGICWVKNHFVLGRCDYHYQHENIIYGWKEGAHSFYGSTGETSVWNFDKPHQNKLHPTMKPIALCAKAITNSTTRGQLVLDLFAGSGSTLIACEQNQRKCYSMELDPHYASVTIERWQQATGKKAVKVN